MKITGIFYDYLSMAQIFLMFAVNSSIFILANS